MVDIEKFKSEFKNMKMQSDLMVKSDCEYCHLCKDTNFYNDDRIDGKTGKPLPLAEDGQTSDLVIQIEDMTLGDDDYELGYEPCAINYCPMCGRKLREDV